MNWIRDLYDQMCFLILVLPKRIRFCLFKQVEKLYFRLCPSEYAAMQSHMDNYEVFLFRIQLADLQLWAPAVTKEDLQDTGWIVKGPAEYSAREYILQDLAEKGKAPSIYKERVR